MIIISVSSFVGNDNDSLLSLSEHSQDALGRLEGDTGVKPPGGSTYDMSKMDPSSALSRLSAGPNSNPGVGLDPLTAGSPSTMMAHHQHLGQRSSYDVGRSPTTQCGVNRMNSLPTDTSRMASGLGGDSKPRIWSLADVAKSEGHSPVRRSLSGMNVVAGTVNTHPAQHPSPHTGQTPYSHPGYRSFQPWVNGAYATSAAGPSGSGLSYSGYSPTLTHHGLSSVGQMTGMARNDMAPTNNGGCVVSPTNYSAKLQNGLLGKCLAIFVFFFLNRRFHCGNILIRRFNY